MKFKNFFVAALFAAVFAFGAYAQPIPYGEAAVFHMQQAQQMQAQQAQPAAHNPRDQRATPQGRGGATAHRGVAMRGQAQTRAGAGTQSRAVVARTATPVAAAAQAEESAPTVNRAATPATQGRAATAPQGRAATQQGQTRGVAARSAAPARARTVAPRAATPQSARIGMIAGSAVTQRPSGQSLNNQLLSQRLWTGNHSNIIDPQTGLLSAEAYANCMEAYYACMDEICTARNPGQRRCACAGRVVTFNSAEQTLQRAREDLLRASGELALVIASGGRDISAAFTLTDAEKVLNCVAFREAAFGNDNAAAQNWCRNNVTAILVTGANPPNCDSATPGSIQGMQPAYCNEIAGSNWLTELGGMDTSIAALLRTADENMKRIDTITRSNDIFTLLNTTSNLHNIILQMGLGGAANVFNIDNQVVDQLAETWGYDLFQFAHNEVCGRVLDSCFNGIFEACQNNNPRNLNSTINISNDNTDVNNAFTVSSGAIRANNARCFGYNTDSDPFENLRGPIADARRSVLIRYALDANADCDMYGEELRTMTQNMSFQRIAAMQALQAKRLEFDMAETTNQRTNAVAARNNFNTCLAEIFECYTETARMQGTWTTTQIKNACAQSSRVPACYREMICNPSSSTIAAVIDVADSTSCNNNQDSRLNTCRNVTTISEILFGTGHPPVDSLNQMVGNSASFREHCLDRAGVGAIRTWDRLAHLQGIVECPENSGFVPESERATVCMANVCLAGHSNQGTVANACRCNSGFEVFNGVCTSQTIACPSGKLSQFPNATAGTIQRDFGDSDVCFITQCAHGFRLVGSALPASRSCESNTRICPANILPGTGIAEGRQAWVGPGANDWGACVPDTCVAATHHLITQNGVRSCRSNTRSCPQGTLPTHATAGTQTWEGPGVNDWGNCRVTACEGTRIPNAQGTACITP
jgi:hypothetical protein